MIRLFRSEPNNLIVVIHQYFILFNFSGQIMSNYSFRFASFGFRSASFRFASFYHSNHLFFDLFQFFSGCRHYMFNSATNWIQKTTICPSLVGASLISSLFLLGHGNNVALPVTLSYTGSGFAGLICGVDL